MSNINKKKTTTETTYNNLSINTNKDKEQPCLIQVLDKYQSHLDDMLEHHSKVM